MSGQLGRKKKPWTKVGDCRWIEKVWVVKEIECIRAEPKIDSLCYRELPFEREVNLRKAKTRNVVSSLGSLSHSRRNREGCRIQSFATGTRLSRSKCS